MPSHDRFRTLFRLAPCGLAVVSLDGHWLEVNRSLVEMLGYRRVELVGDSLETFVHPTDFSGGAVRDALLAGEIGSANVERRFVRRDGTVVWMQVGCSLVRDETGDPEFFVIQCADITAAKAVEQEHARERRWLAESQTAGRIGSWELDLETGEMRWSREQFHLYGVGPEDGVPGIETLVERIHPDDRAAVLTALQAHVASGEDFIEEFRIGHPQLGTRDLVMRGRYLPRDPDLERPARMAGTTLDVTAERAAEADRRRDEARLRLLATIVQQSTDAIVVCDRGGTITQWNEGAHRLYGLSAEEAIGRPAGFLDPPDRDTESADLIAQALRGLPVRSLHTARRRADGELVQVALTVSPIVGGDGQPLGVSAVARDITEQVRAQERLRENERLMYDTQALAHVGSWEWDLKADQMRWSAELARIYGFTPQHAPTVADIVEHVHPEDRERVWEVIEEARSGYPGDAMEYRIVWPNGGVRHVLGVHRTRADDDGLTTHIYCAVQDVTDRRHYEAELERLATRDPLTGLPNRRTFDDRLEMEIARSRREGTTLSLAVLDLDKFKRINDTFGHQIGDDVLILAATELHRRVRSHEVMARVGGEEFAWILPSCDGFGAQIAVERGRRAIAAADFGAAGRVTVSAGICTLEPDMDAAELYHRADMALLAAKAGGRDRVMVAREPGVDPEPAYELGGARLGPPPEPDPEPEPGSERESESDSESGSGSESGPESAFEPALDPGSARAAYAALVRQDAAA